MSCMWNGRVMRERGDTPEGRCLDMIERAISRMGMVRVPAPCRPVKRGVKAIQPYVPPLAADKIAEVLAAWRALPEPERRVCVVAKACGVSVSVAWRHLRKAGLLRSQRERSAMLHARIRAVWDELPQHRRHRSVVAVALGVNIHTVYRALAGGHKTEAKAA